MVAPLPVGGGPVETSPSSSRRFDAIVGRANWFTIEGDLMAERLVYQRSDGKWAWRLSADNGAVIATDGGQGYDNVDDCRSIADRITSGEFANAERLWIEPKS